MRNNHHARTAGNLSLVRSRESKLQFGVMYVYTSCKMHVFFIYRNHPWCLCIILPHVLKTNTITFSINSSFCAGYSSSPCHQDWLWCWCRWCWQHQLWYTGCVLWCCQQGWQYCVLWNAGMTQGGTMSPDNFFIQQYSLNLTYKRPKTPAW